MSHLPPEAELSWLGLNKRLGLSDGAALFSQIEAVSMLWRVVGTQLWEARARGGRGRTLAGGGELFTPLAGGWLHPGAGEGGVTPWQGLGSPWQGGEGRGVVTPWQMPGLQHKQPS
jgi:hypothetical protein